MARRPGRRERGWARRRAPARRPDLRGRGARHGDHGRGGDRSPRRRSGRHGTPPLANRGDPEFVNVVPAGQWQAAYSFYADPTYEDASLVIIRGKQRGAFADVTLECAGTLEGWTPIGTRGDYELVRVDLQRNGGPGQSFGDKVCQTGLHRRKSEGPFTATIWGWAQSASYAYPGGMALRKLVDSPLLPVQ